MLFSDAADVSDRLCLVRDPSNRMTGAHSFLSLSCLDLVHCIISSVLRLPCYDVINYRELLGRDACPRPQKIRPPYRFRFVGVADNRDQRFSSPSYRCLHQTCLFVLSLP